MFPSRIVLESMHCQMREVQIQKFLAIPEFTIATRRPARLLSGDDANTVVSIPEMML